MRPRSGETVDPGARTEEEFPRNRFQHDERVCSTMACTGMIVFAAFYLICVGINWWYYLGPKAEYQNP